MVVIEMAESIRVSVRPEVFEWLRESAGWSVEEVSKRLGTSVKVVMDIEAGNGDPTLRQLEILSASYNRPLALFFLPEPGPEPKLPEDYRMLPDRRNVFDKKTILAIRKARSLQERIRDLAENIGESVESKINPISIGDDPEKWAYKYRELFGISEEKQKEFKTPYNFFNHLRGRMEEMNILVFQFSMPVEDARGFALTDRLPYVAVVNSKDSIEARLFTMMHEFGHLLLGETVIDMPDFERANPFTKDRIEIWCNTFASRFLLPRELAVRIFEEEKRPLTDTKTLNSLKHRYKLSKAMMLYNMWKLGFITKNEYEEVLKRYIPQESGPEEEKEKKEGGAPPIERRRLSEMGEKYVSLVAHNYEKEYITYAEALGYLSVKSKNFDKIVAQASK